MRDFWPDHFLPLSGDELAGLATSPDVESRIVVKQPGQHAWTLRAGPFADADFGGLPARDWTLLVQALDLWVPEIEPLLERINFLPRWRIDDVMASYAVPGGSVGPHFDQYDVFLVQVDGQRRWQLGAACDAQTPLVPGLELKILESFDAQQDWVLEPGDALYVPPGIAHWGIAESHCMTLSVGFRSPLLTDLLGDLAAELAAQAHTEHYRDPPLTPAMGQVAIDPAFISQAREQLERLLADDAALADWFARYMTEPKYPELVEITGERRTARLHDRVYVNGEPED